MRSEKRVAERVVFERGVLTYLMAADGTWRRNCLLEDVSQTGAKLLIKGSIEGLNLKEFFLVLSSTGLAYRRCEVAWIKGDQIGARFLHTDGKKKKNTKRGSTPASV